MSIERWQLLQINVNFAILIRNMYKKITLITGLLALLALPHVSSAQTYDYIPSTEFFSQFAKPRTAESLVEKQNTQAQARRDAAQAEYFAAQDPQDETVHASADVAPSTTAKATTDDYNTFISPQTLATLKALERIEKQRQEADLRSQALSLLGADAAALNLHSGAPLDQYATGKGKGTQYLPNQPQFLPTNNVVLVPVGAGTYLMVLVLCVAVAATIWYSKTSTQQ
jgi:hypothetical protein